MLRACKYCGRLHPDGFVCEKKPARIFHRGTKEAAFRSSRKWREKRDDVVQRDYSLCRVCKDGKYGDSFMYYGLHPKLEVHHIRPLAKRYDLRLEDENLITLCPYHHKLADSGEISVKYLLWLASNPPQW